MFTLNVKPLHDLNDRSDNPDAERNRLEAECDKFQLTEKKINESNKVAECIPDIISKSSVDNIIDEMQKNPSGNLFHESIPSPDELMVELKNDFIDSINNACYELDDIMGKYQQYFICLKVRLADLTSVEKCQEINAQVSLPNNQESSKIILDGWGQDIKGLLEVIHIYHKGLVNFYDLIKEIGGGDEGNVLSPCAILYPQQEFLSGHVSSTSCPSPSQDPIGYALWCLRHCL